MSIIECFLCAIADLLLLTDITLCAGIVFDRRNKTAVGLIVITAVFCMYSILFWSVRYKLENDTIMVFMLLLYVLRFPVAVRLLFRLSFIKGAYMSLLTALICSAVQMTISNIISMSMNDFINSLILIFLYILLFVLLLLTKRSRHLPEVRNVLRMLPVRIYVFVILDVLCIDALISLIGYKTANHEMQITLISVLLLILFLISIIITVLLISNCISKTYYNSINSILEKQIENQLEHYKLTEALNNDLRRFKHDYNNHMLCLKSMISANQYEEAAEYIEKIRNEASPVISSFNTGHKIADAILNDKARANSDIKIDFDGHIPDFLDNVDLCIILGNAVDNAIEACMKLNIASKIISITANYQQSHFVLIITNPTFDDIVIDNVFPETTKDNPLRHGFGLSNIKRVVEKYEGDMSVTADNGVFTLYLAMKK